MPPSDQRIYYFNRHNETSINMLIVAGASGQIYFVKTDVPGSRHDAFIFQTSELYQVLKMGWRPFPSAILLGDSAYTVRLIVQIASLLVFHY